MSLDDDVAAAIEQLRRERDVGLSEVVNEVLRRGLMARPSRSDFVQRTECLGLRIDVRDVAEALELLED